MGVNLFYRFLCKQFCSIDSSSFDRLKRKKKWADKQHLTWNARAVGHLKDFAHAIPRSAHLRNRSFIIAWGRGEDFRGDHLVLGRKKGGSVVTENPKGGITENFGRIKMGDYSNLLGKWRHGGGGEVTFIPPPAINDRSLIFPFDTRHICVLRTF